MRGDSKVSPHVRTNNKANNTAGPKNKQPQQSANFEMPINIEHRVWQGSSEKP